MKKWVNVTDCFSEEGRHYKDTYMEINEVYDEEVEVSLFSTQSGPYEIYFAYGYFYGIIYVEEDEAYAKREEIKTELAQEYQKHKEPISDFVNAFAKKHNVRMPDDILFDTEGLFGF